MPLHKAIFLEPGLRCAKYALSCTCGMNGKVRLPLMATLEAAIDASVKHPGLVSWGMPASF